VAFPLARPQEILLAEGVTQCSKCADLAAKLGSAHPGSIGRHYISKDRLSTFLVPIESKTDATKKAKDFLPGRSRKKCNSVELPECCLTPL